MRIDIRRREPNHAGGYLLQSQFYDAFGRPLQIQTQKEVGGTERLLVSNFTLYEAAGRPIAMAAHVVTDGDPRVRVTSVAGPYTVFAYDAFGRVIRTANVDGTQSTTSYKTAWRVRECAPLQAATTTRGQCTEGETDAAERNAVTRIYVGNSATPTQTERVIFERVVDPGSGRLVSRTRVRRNENAATDVVTTFDLLGRKKTVTHPDAGVGAAQGTWTYGYDLAGSLVYQDDPKTSRHVEITYDGFHRPKTRSTFAGDDRQFEGTPTLVASYDYDTAILGKTRLASVTDPTGSVRALEYNVRGRVLEQERTITFRGVTRTYTTRNRYDAIGRLKKTTYPVGSCPARRAGATPSASRAGDTPARSRRSSPSTRSVRSSSSSTASGRSALWCGSA